MPTLLMGKWRCERDCLRHALTFDCRSNANAYGTHSRLLLRTTYFAYSAFDFLLDWRSRGR
ncbi:hypothetical protein [Planktothrix sp. FACHB-1355]|uniref:hypothetical protein n=1 Tax=Planktothrix sp. FACHB-1355 TaxID=2692854 RepID=UPI00168A882B|nr:hypothetical protein [Planktothrix sp. FACHB-1355]